MAWSIEIAAKAEKELAKLEKQVAKRITSFLRLRVAALGDPRSVGEALKGSRLGEFWKCRVGAYRVVCDIQDERLVVVALSVGHRREVYRP